ncbi:TVP38/TMEM64 family protein [Promethearchaeum syntrophicum]|uniref:TVP38/TMEM64 family protein n=1 Tax=Promethearchaeum syntrophicum TaxID=2594042 RepID=A0A5B9DD76_9ARCH|nr:TVP38/TMEM64 family protein [Candidatus Prometheoarchaeum syntrophicum]
MAIAFTIIVIISIIVFILTIIDNTFLFTNIRKYFILPLLDLGFWAAFIFLFLMVLQSLIAPIPSELVLLSGAMIFGFWWGVILGIIGSMLSAAITYYVSNRGGRSILEATGEKIGLADRMISIMDEWIENWGFWAIVIGRAVPVIMFDPVSYAAGISNIKPKHYYIATLIGSVPRAIFYAYLGYSMLDGNKPSFLETLPQDQFESVSKQFNTIFFVIFGVLVLMLVFANILSYLREKRKENKAK